MSAQEGTGLLGAWELLRKTKLQVLAPLFVRHGIRDVSEIPSKSSLLAAEGVEAWQLELLSPVGGKTEKPLPDRWDIPTVRSQKRASLQAALDAALPNNRRRCLESLERDVLASTTRPSFDPKVKTYMSAWPVTIESIQCFAASLKEGAYKFSHAFFHSVFTYQRRHLQLEVSAVVRGAAKDYTRSISRGLGPSTLKGSFDVEALNAIPIRHEVGPFSLENVEHGRDLLVVACWYMLRELEVASCRWAHIYSDGPTINILLPVQKNDTAGSLTIRSLRCACRVKIHPLCPRHSAQRHLDRVRAHGAFRMQSDFPLVPTDGGTVPTKPLMVQFFRRVIAATGTPTVRPNAEGLETERFSGHVLRVSGAEWLSRLGMGAKLHQF